MAIYIHDQNDQDSESTVEIKPLTAWNTQQRSVLLLKLIESKCALNTFFSKADASTQLSVTTITALIQDLQNSGGVHAIDTDAWHQTVCNYIADVAVRRSSVWNRRWSSPNAMIELFTNPVFSLKTFSYSFFTPSVSEQVCSISSTVLSNADFIWWYICDVYMT